MNIKIYYTIPSIVTNNPEKLIFIGTGIYTFK